MPLYPLCFLPSVYPDAFDAPSRAPGWPAISSSCRLRVGSPDSDASAADPARRASTSKAFRKYQNCRFSLPFLSNRDSEVGPGSRHDTGPTRASSACRRSELRAALDASVPKGFGSRHCVRSARRRGPAYRRSNRVNSRGRGCERGG